MCFLQLCVFVPSLCRYIYRLDEPPRAHNIPIQEVQDILINLMTIMYMCIQETLNDPEGLNDVYERLCRYLYNLVPPRPKLTCGPCSESRAQFINLYAHGLCEAAMARRECYTHPPGMSWDCPESEYAC